MCFLTLVIICLSFSSGLHPTNKYAMSDGSFDYTNTNCPGASMIFVTMRKTNSLFSSESCKVTTSAGIVILIIEPSTSSLVATACVETGNYILELASQNDTAWDSSSYVTLQITVGSDTYTVMRYRLEGASMLQVPFSLNFPVRNVEFSVSKLYFADGTIPSGWNSDSFVPSGWSSYDASSPPSITQPIHFVYSSFSVSDLLSFHSFELRVRGNAGILAVVNGHEVFRTNLPAGQLTESTRATTGSSTLVGYSATCDLSLLRRGENHVIVAFVSTTQQSTFTLHSDMTIRLDASSNIVPHYWDISSYGARNDGSMLFDLDSSTYYYESREQLSRHSVTLSYEQNRNDFVNMYCFITSSASENYDPMAWTVQGVNSTGVYLVDTQDECYFLNRQDRYYFYILPHWDAFPSYRFTFTQNAQNGGGYFSLADIELLTADFSGLELPGFSISPSSLHLIVGISFTSPMVSSSYYSRFSISPSLPKGLHLSSNDGRIWGVAEEESASRDYTVSARTPLGGSVTTVIELSCEVCHSDHVEFEMSTVCNSGCTGCTLELLRLSNQQTVFSLSSLLSGTAAYSFCEPEDTFQVHVTRSSTTECTGLRVHVVIQGQFNIATFSLQPDSLEGDFTFDPRRLVSLDSSWKYLVKYVIPPEGWNTPQGFVESWEEATPGNFPQAEGVSQFYATRFTIDRPYEIVGLRFSAVIYAGAVFYLNGEELARVNLPETPITISTPALIRYEIPVWYSVSESVNGGRIGHENVFAMELHTIDFFEENPSFMGIVTLLTDTSDMIFNGVASTQPIVSTPEVAFDNDITTDVMFSTTCEDSEIMWRYVNDFEVINSYTVWAGNHCLQNYPTGWNLEGSQNGIKWFPLHRASGRTFSPNSQIRFDFYNVKAYRYYRLYVTSCNGTAACDGKLYLSDLMFHLRRISFDCYSEEYPPGLFGEITFIECPVYADGYISLLCTPEGYELSEYTCTATAPGEFQYPVETIVLHQSETMDDLVPLVESWGHVITVNPMLPDGLTISSSTGVISGKPRYAMDFAEYEIELKNSKGSKKTTLGITILKKEMNAVLLVIEVVIVIVIIIIVVMVIRIKKSRKMRKQLPTHV